MISERVVRKYAGIVTKQDVEYLLFSLLDKEKLSAIARTSGLTRRTLYKLRDRTDIRISTKLKLLRASFETSPNDIFSFLVERYKDNATGVLMSYLSYLYNEAMKTSNDTIFGTTLSKFLEARSKNYGLISDEIENEVETMLRFLEESATKFRIAFPIESIRTTKQEHLLSTLPLLVSSIHSGDNTPTGIARLFDVPIEWVQSVASVTKDVALRIPKIEEPSQLTAATIIPTREHEIEPSYYSPLSQTVGTIY